MTASVCSCEEIYNFQFLTLYTNKLVSSLLLAYVQTNTYWCQGRSVRIQGDGRPGSIPGRDKDYYLRHPDQTNCNNNTTIIIIIYLTASGLSPGGSGCYA
jgi:hypothetical protein